MGWLKNTSPSVPPEYENQDLSLDNSIKLNENIHFIELARMETAKIETTNSSDSENENCDDSVNDKDWKEKESIDISSDRSSSECDDILIYDNINEQGINVIINEVCESAIAEAQELIPINKKIKKRVTQNSGLGILK